MPLSQIKTLVDEKAFTCQLLDIKGVGKRRVSRSNVWFVLPGLVRQRKGLAALKNLQIRSKVNACLPRPLQKYSQRASPMM